MYRYQLVVEDRSRPQGESICVIMQNPSDADEFQADKSVQFLENLIFRKGYMAFKNISKMTIVNWTG